MSITNTSLMSREAAMKAMRDGELVAHRYFAHTEWVKETEDGMYEFEDGCLCSKEDFWRHRTGPTWDGGWKIFDYQSE